MSMLKPHIRSAQLGALTILLDLKRNKYLALPSEDLRAALESGSASRMWRQLVCRGLVEATSPPLRLVRPHLRLWHAFAWSARQLSRGRLDLTFREIARRKLGPEHGADIIPAAVAFYRQWRPWYPGRVICLFDSLALLKFLLSMGAPAALDLVIGVRGMPFDAHCWIEREGSVLNDEAAYCASFIEIARA